MVVEETWLSRLYLLCHILLTLHLPVQSTGEAAQCVLEDIRPDGID